jgi:hypothetical protein
MTLAITALTRKTAILHLIRQCHAEQPGTPVLLTVLMVAWTQLGLRGDDLSTGLNEMLEDGSLRLDPDHKNPSVALSESGKAWMDGPGANPQLRMEQERILRSVRQRADGLPPQAAAPGQVPRWQIVDRRVRFDRAD